MQKIIFTLAITILLASCSSKIKQKVGIEDMAPDELLVETHRPLYVPPHYELPEPPAPDISTPKVKKKISWMFWKKDTNTSNNQIVKSEETITESVSTPKKKWFWQKEKTEKVVESNIKAKSVKKKPFWKREKKVTTYEG